MKRIGRNRNIAQEATLSIIEDVTPTLTKVIVPANPERVFFHINNNGPIAGGAVWLKLQPASVDDDKKGIYIPSGGSWTMPPDTIYTGEISAISVTIDTTVYVTEY